MNLVDDDFAPGPEALSSIGASPLSPRTAGREPQIPAHILSSEGPDMDNGSPGIGYDDSYYRFRFILNNEASNITKQERDALAPIIRKEAVMANKDKGGKKRKKDKAVKPKASPKSKAKNER